MGPAGPVHCQRSGRSGRALRTGGAARTDRPRGTGGACRPGRTRWTDRPDGTRRARRPGSDSDGHVEGGLHAPASRGSDGQQVARGRRILRHHRDDVRGRPRGDAQARTAEGHGAVPRPEARAVDEEVRASASAWRISGPSPWSDSPRGSFSRHWSRFLLPSLPLSRFSLPPRASGTNASAAATRAVTPQCDLMRIHPGPVLDRTGPQGPRREKTLRVQRVAIEARNTPRCPRRLRESVEQISAAPDDEMSHRARRVERAPRGLDSAVPSARAGGSGVIQGSKRRESACGARQTPSAQERLVEEAEHVRFRCGTAR